MVLNGIHFYFIPFKGKKKKKTTTGNSHDELTDVVPDSGQESRLPPLDKPPQHVARCAVQAEGIFVLEDHQAHQLHLDVQLLVILEIKAKNKEKMQKNNRIYIFFIHLYFLFFSFILSNQILTPSKRFAISTISSRTAVSFSFLNLYCGFKNYLQH